MSVQLSKASKVSILHSVYSWLHPSLGLPFGTQISGSLAVLSTGGLHLPRHSQAACALGDTGVWGMIVSRFFFSYGCCQPVRTFGQRRNLLLLISGNYPTFTGGPGRASCCWGRGTAESKHSGNVAGQLWGWGSCSRPVVSG